MVLEEAAYCDTQVVNEVVLPLLSVSSSVLLCISTLRESDNFYSKMFSMPKADGSGDLLFETIQITTVCDACRASDAPEKCNHKQSELPRWLSSTKMETIKALLADNPALLLRESMGITAESTTNAFKEASVKEFHEADKKDPMPCKHIFLAVDPSGGGESAFGITTLAVHSNGDTVVRALAIRPQTNLTSLLCMRRAKCVVPYGFTWPQLSQQHGRVAKEARILTKARGEGWYQHGQDALPQIF